jgi:hypothetical protein
MVKTRIALCFLLVVSLVHWGSVPKPLYRYSALEDYFLISVGVRYEPPQLNSYY